MNRASKGDTGEGDTPGVIAPPPLIFAAFLIAGWMAGRWLGLPTLGQVAGLEAGLRNPLAIVLIVVGLGLEAWAAGRFRRARTNVVPWKPSTALVTDGPYSFSRNPIYVGFALTYAGIATGLDSIAALAGLIPCLIVVDRFVIVREERYLAARFGTAFDHYRQKVRRWL